MLLLSETWISHKTAINLEINGFYSEHVFGSKTPGAVKGRYSGGVSVYVKNYLKKSVQIIEKNPIGLLWVKINSDVFVFREDVILCNVYIPPAESRIFNTMDNNYWDEIEKGIELYSTCANVYVVGDMNGRTSDFPDILDFDKYLEDNDLFSNISHVPMRVNKDHIVDSHGRKLLDLCKSSGFIIANGRLGDDYGIGEVTYHSTHGVSTVDYLLLHNTDIGSFYLILKF